MFANKQDIGGALTDQELKVVNCCDMMLQLLEVVDTQITYSEIGTRIR